MSFNTLAREKQQEVSGGNVNYYLTELSNKTVVETEDVIEHFRMEFSLATSFKSIDRQCKERLGLGKPGSTPKYETGKVIYYNRRSYAQSMRAEQQVGIVGKIIRWCRDLGQRPRYLTDINDLIIHIKNPKRLDPYSFKVRDFIDALAPTMRERWVLENIFDLAQARYFPRLPRKHELYLAEIANDLATGFENEMKDAQPSH